MKIELSYDQIHHVRLEKTSDKWTIVFPEKFSDGAQKAFLKHVESIILLLNQNIHDTENKHDLLGGCINRSSQ